MNFNTRNYGFNIQLIPTYGIALGFLYYNPNLEPSLENVQEENFYEQITILFLVFGIHLTWWKL